MVNDLNIRIGLQIMKPSQFALKHFVFSGDHNIEPGDGGSWVPHRVVGRAAALHATHHSCHIRLQTK
jgi:hypothetical protein